jgi:hypothetical protein
MPFDGFFPRPLNQEAIRTYAPTVSGVYGISSADHWLYVGETDNIQGALLYHVQQSDSAIQKSRPTGFVFEVCDRMSRPARRDRLVLEYEPTCNRHARS